MYTGPWSLAAMRCIAPVVGPMSQVWVDSCRKYRPPVEFGCDSDDRLNEIFNKPLPVVREGQTVSGDGDHDHLQEEHDAPAEAIRQYPQGQAHQRAGATGDDGPLVLQPPKG